MAQKNSEVRKFTEFSTNKEIHKKWPNHIQTYGEGTPKPCLCSSSSSFIMSANLICLSIIALRTDKLQVGHYLQHLFDVVAIFLQG